MPAGDQDLAEPPEPAARLVFADHLPLARRYAELLATEGVVRGLIGPREAPRLWERHLLNCAVLGEIVPNGSSVVDVGSGAGLPGIVLAVARPDLTVTLVEPMARRTAFLSEAVEALGLGARVPVVRARAEEYPGPPADVVTARAVASLDRLASWCLPLVRPGGRLLALKGESAAEEIAEHRVAITRLGGGTPVIRYCGAEVLDPPTTVVEIVQERSVAPAGGRSRARRR
ncbi:MAG TPA: 16S rRNA (guanine(527)-N(7))-methyltransferase RsmG [Rugosimonospora sp.]|nr:16S rRNA (guanine(527)-N(7))-methyltransferase RsmG [Rugosimonospora sp.]